MQEPDQQALVLYNRKPKNRNPKPLFNVNNSARHNDAKSGAEACSLGITIKSRIWVMMRDVDNEGDDDDDDEDGSDIRTCFL